MAAYAALVSLMNTMDQIQNHTLYSSSLDKKQIESLHRIIGFLLHFIENHNSHKGSEEKEVLESQIASAAHAAEDAIESHVVDQILAGSTGDHGETSLSSLLDLETVIDDMNSVKEKVMEFIETKEFKDLQPSYSIPPSSSKSVSTGENVMVGFDDELIQLMDRLTGDQSNLHIVPIVGMGGIGKTTLARNVYENLVTVEHFDIRAWVTISQEYSVKEILSQLQSCIRNKEINKSLGTFDCETDGESEDQLGVKLYQSLSGRRYLIVLDDMWSIEAWNMIKFFFPDNESGSRIVITSRISNVATQFSSSSFQMNFLDEDKSWKLFCRKTFLEESCPPDLEKIGRKIVRECKGLPLSIAVVGGLLRNSRRTTEYWESFGSDINSILKSEDDEYCLNILSLSYNHLPAHLKPCFLYMGVFREDEKIHASRLIKIFVAEGFLKPKIAQTFEEVAEDYLKDLADRNLILVGSKKWNGTIKYCEMHDLVREVCLRIAKKEKFFYVMRVLGIPPGIDKERRIVYHSSISPKFHGAVPSASLVRTYKYMEVPLPFKFRLFQFREGPLPFKFRLFKSMEEGPLPFKFRLLRVFASVEFECLEAIFQQVNLRYLSRKLSWRSKPKDLPSTVSLLWNVQTLIIRGSTKRINAPPEIWYMRQLRHVQFDELFLPNPPPSDEVEQQDDLLLPNLQTLSKVVNFSFTEEVCKRIPNIKKLRIKYDMFYGECQNLGHLHKLQSLDCMFYPKRGDLLQSLVFPSSLRKLSLQNSHLHWENLNTVGLLLPHLEVLILAEHAIVGPEWDTVDGAFPRLKFLKMCCGDLIKWTVENSDSFPLLEKLHLQNLENLEKIPLGMGEIHTLRYLDVKFCSESAAISSTEILKEQLSLGYEDLRVEVLLKSNEEEERLREMVEIESFTTKNFQYKTPASFIKSFQQAFRSAVDRENTFFKKYPH